MVDMLKKPNTAWRAARVEARRLRGRFNAPRDLFRHLEVTPGTKGKRIKTGR